MEKQIKLLQKRADEAEERAYIAEREKNVLQAKLNTAEK